jgi:hypothetical protein
MLNLKLVGTFVVVAAISFSAGRFLGPAKVETKEVERVVYRQSTDLTRNVDKKETIRPDGTRIIETVSTTKKSTDTNINKESVKSSTTENRPNWHLSVTYTPILITERGQNVTTVNIQRRILSEIYLGASYSTDQVVGVSIGLGF